MTKLMTTLTISVIASIMIIGGFVLAPDAYSTNDNNEPDECACEKPDTLKVKFNAPTNSQESTFKIDVFKKFEDRNDPKKIPLMTFDNVPKVHVEGNDLVVSAIVFGKDKLESNTAFVVYNESDGKLVALMEIHTSCSKPLFVGKTVFDNDYSLEVSEGTKGGMSSIPESEPLTCEDKKAKSTGTITIRKALTNDNDGAANVEDFTITVTNVKTTESFVLEKDQLDLSINVKDVPQGTYKISETGPDGYTTVMITGDTKCPSILGEEFTIKKGKNLSCTIYNDDDFNADGTSGGDGIFFVRNSISFDPRSAGTCEFDQGNPPNINNSPCIVVDGGTLFIADPTLDDPAKAPFAIITSTIIQITTGALSPPQCIFLGVSEMDGVIGFGFDCLGIQVDGSTYNANYAIIDASPQG